MGITLLPMIPTFPRTASCMCKLASPALTVAVLVTRDEHDQRFLPLLQAATGAPAEAALKEVETHLLASLALTGKRGVYVVPRSPGMRPPPHV